MKSKFWSVELKGWLRKPFFPTSQELPTLHRCNSADFFWSVWTSEVPSNRAVFGLFCGHLVVLKTCHWRFTKVATCRRPSRPAPLPPARRLAYVKFHNTCRYRADGYRAELLETWWWSALFSHSPIGSCLSHCWKCSCHLYIWWSDVFHFCQISRSI